METQGDLIEEAVRAGKLTVCSPRRAMGHRKKKARRGERVRPCRRCGRPIKYANSTWTAFGQRRRGWHWVNEGGSHHRCGDFIEAGVNRLVMQWRTVPARARGANEGSVASAAARARGEDAQTALCSNRGPKSEAIDIRMPAVARRVDEIDMYPV